MAKRIQIRRDTAANWTAANPVLAQAEIGIELDGLGTSTVLQKIGDGVTAWDSLPYQESGGGVETVSGDGVDNADPENPVLSFPNADEIDDSSTSNKFATASQLLAIASNTQEIALNDDKITALANSKIDGVTGDGVDNTDPLNPSLSFPIPSDIGLGNVDNTSDADKPISDATQTALNDKADDTDLTALGSTVSINSQNIILLDTRVTTNEGDIQTLQNNQVNPNNFVIKVTSTTQDMTGRLTVQTPVDANISDAANVEYVNNKLGDYIEEATVASSTEKGGLFFDYDSVTNTLILKAQ